MYSTTIVDLVLPNVVAARKGAEEGAVEVGNRHTIFHQSNRIDHVH